jgi:hypothetical protein
MNAQCQGGLKAFAQRALFLFQGFGMERIAKGVTVNHWHSLALEILTE